MTDQQVNREAGASNGSSNILDRIHQALEIVHSPYSSNNARRDAQSFLEDVKTVDEAPFHGYTLAANKLQPPVVRHYALSLLDNAIKLKWAEYTEDQAGALRNWMLELCRNVSKDDPGYIRNKTAQLWVEIAKRSWGSEWINMDELLVQLWQTDSSIVHHELVMTVLETLGYEIFFGDDVVATMRQGVLCKGWTEIMTPADVIAEATKNRNAATELRSGTEGWLVRLVTLLDQTLSADMDSNREAEPCATKALSALATLMPCSLPKAMAAANVVPVCCRALAVPRVSVQKGALEVLHAIYSRDDFWEQEFAELVAPMYEGQSVNLLRMLFEWCVVDAEDIDDEKYMFSKKFTEMLSMLGNYMDRRFAAVPTGSDVDGFLHLLLAAVQSQSLVVSIPVLVTWTRLLSNRLIGQSSANSQIIGPLLELCGARLIRYDSLPEDSQDQTYLFLMEDTDTVPERHAFLGNYRRYSSQVIEAIVLLKPQEAISHILGQTEHLMSTLYDGEKPLDVAKYAKYSMPVLRADAHMSTIDAVIKGYMKWRMSSTHRNTPDYDQQRAALEEGLESWSNKLLAMSFEDPMIRKRILQILVALSTSALDKKPDFMLKVLEHILMTWPPMAPEHKAFNDAIRDLQSESMFELQRLASKVPDHLLAVYDQLESRVKEMISSGTLDEKRQISYQTFLFIIIHRATNIESSLKMARLRGFVEPIVEQWRNPELQTALNDYQGFCRLMAIDKAKGYLMSHRAHEIKDWSVCELDAEGLALQAELEERQRVLPLRSIKSFLSYSVERQEKSSESFQANYALWGGSFSIVLPELLKLLSHAHASHSPDSWAEFPAESQSVVKQVLSDRFWQAGISEGSKDQFYARVTDSKNTLEGLASTIRGSIRFVRETCYAAIYCMSRLEAFFYGLEGLPEHLAQSMFENAVHLSAHQQINLLNLTRYLVDDCPLERRDYFLPPLLAACFRQMDLKINSEWERLDHQQLMESGGESLTEEMKSESILRQVTHTAVIMIADFLDPTKKNPSPQQPNDPPRQYPTLRKFCLVQSRVVEPLLMFCTHAIRMRDTRCCSIILRVLKSIVPDFSASPQPFQPPHGSGPDPLLDTSPIPPDEVGPIREYISSEVLRACITSFHEPYFVDLQKELAALIAAIVVYYSPLTNTPKDVMLSLPSINATDVHKLCEFSTKPGSQTRQQRALVLHLLKDLKGVSIAEMGKLTRSSLPALKKPNRSKMAQQFMTPAKAPGAGSGDTGVDDERLEGLANLFDA